MGSVEEQDKGVGAYTKDGSVDLKGRPVLRSKTGGWTACSFVVVYEVFERMAYYGISSNLVIYLTTRLHEGTIQSSNNVTNWVGTVWLTPILGAYVADAILGRYWTFIVASAIYLMGMSLLTLSVSISPLKPALCSDQTGATCQKATGLQLGVFFGALYTLAVGTGGTKPNISTIGADQFDEFEPKEKSHKLSFFNWWMFSIFFGTLFANTILVYIQDNVGWSLGYGLPTIGLAVSIAIFLAGTPFYRHKLPTGSSPFSKMARVIVAAIRKWNVPVSYEINGGDLIVDQNRQSLSFLNKASMETGKTSKWILCTATEVEETKQMLRMIPILITTFIPSTMVAQIGTLFVKQGTTLDRSIGSFKIPPASLTAFVTLSMLISVVFYDQILVKIIRKWTKNPRGITLLQRMGTGMLIHILIMTVASLTEKHRLEVARAHGDDHKGNLSIVPLSIFVLLPQFILMGIADAFLEVAKIEFFYDQAPESMKSLGTSYSMTSLGIGNFLSSGILSTVSRITRSHGNEGWIRNNLNASHLDYYYAFLAILTAINFGVFLFLVRFYVYKVEVSDSMEILKEELENKGAATAREQVSLTEGKTMER